MYFNTIPNILGSTAFEYHDIPANVRAKMLEKCISKKHLNNTKFKQKRLKTTQHAHYLWPVCFHDVTFSINRLLIPYIHFVTQYIFLVTFVVTVSSIGGAVRGGFAYSRNSRPSGLRGGYFANRQN